MTIKEVTEQLNKRSVEGGYRIGNLPILRRRYFGKTSGVPNKLFTHLSIAKDGRWAFHYGGRKEMQFNIGTENWNGRECTRVCLAFSLESSRDYSETKLISILSPYKERFNQLINKSIVPVKDFRMWYHYNNGMDKGKSKLLEPQIIPDKWFEPRSFISIGKIIDKPISELDSKDIETILSIFDSLLPIYDYVVLNNDNVLKNEARIARICWNEGDWMAPSGNYGKSHDQTSQERAMGYGHEEWLFDFEKLINGYHYAFLQAVEIGRLSYIGKKFDVKLYSSNLATKERKWVGSIKNLEVISNEAAIPIHTFYEEKKWLDSMALDINDVEGDAAHFLNLRPQHYFNVRFKPEDAVLDKPYKHVQNFNELIGTHHYQFIFDKLNAPSKKIEKSTIRNFVFKAGKSEKSLKDRISVRREKIVQSRPDHDKIQEILYQHLIKEYTEDSVGMENDTGLSTRIDISVKTDTGIILYEVKSYPAVMMSIRAALGQLLEYAFYPNPIENLEELIIVSHIPIGPEDVQYLKYLREKFALRIYYQSIDLYKKTLSEKI